MTGLVPVIHVVVYGHGPRMQSGGRSRTTTTNLSGVDHGRTWMTRTSPVMRCGSTLRNCLRFTICSRRAAPAPRSCARNGATTSSSKPFSISASRRLWTLRSASREKSRPRDNAWRRSSAGASSRLSIAGWTITLHSADQMPHITRNGLSECLGIDQGEVRIVSPDVGGGFGYKGILSPEAVCLGWLAMRCGFPVRWLEDRREHLSAGANCREHHYRITAYADRDGRLRGIDCEATVDSGAYSSYPFTACLEAAQVASILPGPYDFPSYRCRTYSVATNKCPILPYRGVARTGVCFALELVLDAIAREAGIEPHEVRSKILVKPEQMPFNNITKKHFDSGDYPESLRRAVASIDVAAVRARQQHGEADGRLIGVGVATYCEQAAHGTSVYHGWGIPMVPGFEQATARLTPDG